jgi:hypothetical protein
MPLGSLPILKVGSGAIGCAIDTFEMCKSTKTTKQDNGKGKILRFIDLNLGE